MLSDLKKKLDEIVILYFFLNKKMINFLNIFQLH